MTDDRPHIIDDLPALAAASRQLMFDRIAAEAEPSLPPVLAIAHPRYLARALDWEMHRRRYLATAAAVGIDEDTARSVLDAVVAERQACDVPTDAADVFAEARDLLHTLSYDTARLTGQAPKAVRPHPEQAAEMLAHIRALHTGIVRTYTAAARPLMGELARALAALTASARQAAGAIGELGKPARPRDRPAWQSPYGPSRHRRR